MRTDHVADMDEEAQLAAAIKASLVETLAASNPQVSTIKGVLSRENYKGRTIKGVLSTKYY